MEEGGIVEAIPLDGSNNPEVAQSTQITPCRMYLPGHQVHPIQAKLAFQTTPSPISILRVSGNRITIDSDGTTFVYRNHRAGQIKALLHQYGSPLPAWMYGYGVIACQGLLFCVDYKVNGRFRNWRHCR